MFAFPPLNPSHSSYAKKNQTGSKKFKKTWNKMEDGVPQRNAYNHIRILTHWHKSWMNELSSSEKYC